MLTNEIGKEIVRIGYTASGRENGFSCYMSFVVDSLNLIVDKFPENARHWLDVVEECRGGLASPGDVQEAADQVCKYAGSLGEISEDDISTPNGAIAYLLMLALYHENSAWRPDRADIIIALEEFIDKFTDFFGGGDTILLLLKKNFG